MYTLVNNVLVGACGIVLLQSSWLLTSDYCIYVYIQRCRAIKFKCSANTFRSIRRKNVPRSITVYNIFEKRHDRVSSILVGTSFFTRPSR